MSLWSCYAGIYVEITIRDALDAGQKNQHWAYFDT